MKQALLLLALACAGCAEKERPIAWVKPEAHDIFGPDICSRRTWPFGTVLTDWPEWPYSKPERPDAAMVLLSGNGPPQEPCKVGEVYVSKDGSFWTCSPPLDIRVYEEVDEPLDPKLYHIYDSRVEPPSVCADPKRLFLYLKGNQAGCLRESPVVACCQDEPPKLMYAWKLPGETIQRTCKLGEQFVDSKGQIYICGQWPPYEKR